LQLGDKVTMQKRRMTSALFFGLLSSKTPKKKTICTKLQPAPIMTYCRTILEMCKDLFYWCFQLKTQE
jgi:hypothetical protein